MADPSCLGESVRAGWWMLGISSRIFYVFIGKCLIADSSCAGKVAGLETPAPAKLEEGSTPLGQ